MSQLIASTDYYFINLPGQLYSFDAPGRHFAGIGKFIDGYIILLKKLLCFGARRSTFAVIHPIYFMFMHDKLLGVTAYYFR